MAQVILTCFACGEEVGLQAGEEAPEVGCINGDEGRHDWQENVQRVRLVSEILLPEGADPDGFADSVSDFLAGLDDPKCTATRTDVQYPDPYPPATVRCWPTDDGSQEFEVEYDGEVHRIQKDEPEDEEVWTVDTFQADDPDGDAINSASFPTLAEALAWVLPEEHEVEADRKGARAA